MPTSWRIVNNRFARSAFDGDGARINGGRWNSVGIPMVYTSGSPSLAMLEILVHVENEKLLRNSYSVLSADFEEKLVTSVDKTKLPSDWASLSPPPSLQAIGDKWLADKTSAVLQVPSAIVALESNYLINPNHEDFRLIVMGSPQPLRFDERLRKK